MITVAVVGATGAVGREILAVLEERRFPVGELRLLASDRSAGRVLRALQADHEVRPAAPDAFAAVDLALFSAGARIAGELAPAARAAGALVVDNSSAFRMRPDCPLVIPEINGQALMTHGGLIANPNCSTILLCMAVAPLVELGGLLRIVACTYQAVSGAGARAVEELRRQEAEEAEGKPLTVEVLPAPISHNVIPWVQAIGANGYSVEENKVRDETRRILGLPDLAVSATCVRVPVWRAHSAAVHTELERPVPVARLYAALRGRPGVRVVPEGIVTPRDAAGGDDVWVGRVRQDRVFSPGLALWCVMDQLRKGAALNAVQIAEQALGCARPA